MSNNDKVGKIGKGREDDIRSGASSPLGKVIGQAERHGRSSVNCSWNR